MKEENTATYVCHMAACAHNGCGEKNMCYTDLRPDAVLQGMGREGKRLKIEVIVDDKVDDLHISVVCRQLTPEIEKLLENLRMMNHQLTAKKNDETYLLDLADVIYIESIDRKCFVYTAAEVYESNFRLYELESQLEEFGFLRVSKSFLIHLQKVHSLRADINRKIRITMSNGEQIIASRQYADELKKRLGVI